MKRIIVASRNPVKINAVQNGFEKMFPSETCQIEGASIPSGVSDQPMTNSETLIGAHNRANNAQKDFPDRDLRIGIEGGVDITGDDMEAFARVVIKSITITGKAKTSTFFLPPKIIELINQGKELGEANDIIFGHTNSKQKNGAAGILTGNAINRTQFYTEAVVLAFIPFKNADLFG